MFTLRFPKKIFPFQEKKKKNTCHLKICVTIHKIVTYTYVATITKHYGYHWIFDQIETTHVRHDKTPQRA